MQYKTIILELLKERPQMHERLRQERKLLPALEIYARELKASHQGWMEALTMLRPGSNPAQISSEAMETALKELEERLPAESPAEGEETLSLDQAMAFIRRHTSRA